MKKQIEGITLVALVITIIILLMLAGITFMQLTDNGLFEKAIQAKEKSENAKIKENVILSNYEEQVKQYIDGTREQIIADYKSDGTEVKTNERLDGKPIYARYFNMEYSGSGWYSKEHNIENIEKIWIDAGNSYILSDENDEAFGILPSCGNGVGFKVDKEKVWRYGVGHWDAYATMLLLKYTKTTD